MVTRSKKKVVWTTGVVSFVVIFLCLYYFAEKWRSGGDGNSSPNNKGSAKVSPVRATTILLEEREEGIDSEGGSHSKMRNWGQGEITKALSELKNGSFHSRRLAAERMLSEGSSKDRFLGGLFLLREGGGNEEVVAKVAHDADPRVPLHILGWMRDRFQSDDVVKSLAEEIAERDDFGFGDLENWIRDPEIGAPAVRAALDLMETNYDNDKFRRSLEPLVSDNSGRGALNSLRLEAGLRLAEVAGPAEVLRVSGSRGDFASEEDIQVLGIESVSNVQGELALAQEREALDSRVNIILSSLFNLPPPLQQSQSTLLRQADLANAWAAADRRGLTEVASIVERAVIEGRVVQLGVFETLDRIVSGTRDATPLKELSRFQQYENERIVRGVEILRSHEMVTMDPSSDPRL